MLVLLPLVAGWVGFYRGAMRDPAVSHVPADATVALDYLISPESFSEVAQARAVLEAAAARYVEYAQRLLTRDRQPPDATTGKRDAGASRPRLAAIRLLEEALAEFKGTGQEWQLLPTLLLALRQEQLYDRWLRVYLTALYEQPTHRMVTLLADEAVKIGRALGREEEVAAAFRHLDGLPPELRAPSPGESHLVQVLSEVPRTRPCDELAWCSPQS